LSLTAVSALREINGGIDTEAAALGLEVNSAMARLKGQVLQVGRQSLLQAEMLPGAQGFRSALNVAVAQECTRALLDAYYRDNYKGSMAKPIAFPTWPRWAEAGCVAFGGAGRRTPQVPSG
jgi:hypothetical protein